MKKEGKKPLALLLSVLLCIVALPAQRTLAAGEIEITSLSEINASGSYILMDDCTANSVLTIDETWDVTLDFNGHTVTNAQSARCITNRGSLTLLDQSGGNGGITGVAGTSLGAVDNFGTLVVQSGSYSASGTNGSVIRNQSGATLRIEGGTFAGRRALANFGTAVINGGTLMQNSSEQAYTIHSERGSLTIRNATIIGNFGGISVTGGTCYIRNANVSAEKFHALYIDEFYATLDVTVAGGTFEGGENGLGLYVLVGAEAADETNPIPAGEVKVTGGSYSGGAGAASIAVDPDAEPGNHIVLTGGSFPGVDVSEYVPKGYELNEDGTVKSIPEPTPSAYTIRFVDGWGGEYTLRATLGSHIAPPENPVHAGHIFAGWYRDEAGTKPWNFEKDRVYGDMTLYAGWVGDVINPPKTGDASTPVGLCLLAAGIAGATLVSALRRKKQ